MVRLFALCVLAAIMTNCANDRLEIDFEPQEFVHPTPPEGFKEWEKVLVNIQASASDGPGRGLYGRSIDTTAMMYRKGDSLWLLGEYGTLVNKHAPLPRMAVKVERDTSGAIVSKVAYAFTNDEVVIFYKGAYDKKEWARQEQFSNDYYAIRNANKHMDGKTWETIIDGIQPKNSADGDRYFRILRCKENHNIIAIPANGGLYNIKGLSLSRLRLNENLDLMTLDENGNPVVDEYNVEVPPQGWFDRAEERSITEDHVIQPINN